MGPTIVKKISGFCGQIFAQVSTSHFTFFLSEIPPKN